MQEQVHQCLELQGTWKYAASQNAPKIHGVVYIQMSNVEAYNKPEKTWQESDKKRKFNTYYIRAAADRVHNPQWNTSLLYEHACCNNEWGEKNKLGNKM